jgi:hypothetical protein
MYQQLQRTKAKAITPSDTADIFYSNAGDNSGCLVYVGTKTPGQSVRVKTVSGDDVTFVNIPQGTILPVFVVRVFATGTTATNLVAVW